MLGNRAARATVMSALAEISCCSDSATSGRRASSERGQALDHLRAGEGIERAGVHIDRLGSLAEQHRERVHRLAELLLQRRNRRTQQRHRGLLLGHVQPCGDARGLLQLQAVQDFLAVGEIFARHLQPVAKFAALENRWWRRC